ncbi:MAG: hypothetical protein SFW67_05940 [Myxococcaceae bacterium]|nr:hypothetical protein [Myxococcaceae bacterium]
MGLNAVVFFRLAKAPADALLKEAGFKKTRSLWRLAGTEGVFSVEPGAKQTLVAWDTFTRFDELGDRGLQRELLADVKRVASALGADAVACVPSGSETPRRKDFVPRAKATAKALFSGAEALSNEIPDDIRELLGLDD